jgi:hypothetical protein
MRHRTCDLRGKAYRWERGVPAPELDELEPEAIGEGDGVSVGERVAAGEASRRPSA